MTIPVGAHNEIEIAYRFCDRVFSNFNSDLVSASESGYRKNISIDHTGSFTNNLSVAFNFGIFEGKKINNNPKNIKLPVILIASLLKLSLKGNFMEPGNDIAWFEKTNPAAQQSKFLIHWSKIEVTMSEIIFNVDNNIGYITLNRPEQYNSFNRPMAVQMQEALQECCDNNDIRAVVIRGEGKAFCAGQDLGEASDPDGPELTKIVSEHYNPIILLIRKIEKPVIAAINGVAAGAGANIALACDITIATASAKFIQAFSQIGLIPDSGGTYFLPRIIGYQKATALMMLGDKVSAEEAEHIGMIYRSVSDEEFDSTIQKTAEKLAKMPTKGLGLTKMALNKSATNDLKMQLCLEDELQTRAGKTEDYSEGVQAFLDKRKPEFKGQ